MAKFKVNDIIRLLDEKDMGYRACNLQTVVNVTETGYDLYSHKFGKIRKESELLETIQNYLKNPDECETVQQFYDTYYRLATISEITIHGRKEV